jgi:hypothetical protein
MQKFAGFNQLSRYLFAAACLVTVSIASAGTPAPTVSISASPFMVTLGEQSRITWSSTNATSCVASGHWTGEKPLSDSKNTRKLTSSETFILTCTGPGGSATNQVTVAVVGGTPTDGPTVKVTATPSTITAGSRTLISWSTTNATSCTGSGDWTGSQALSGAKNTGALTTDEVFALTCTGPGGTASQSATVTVASAPPTGTATLSWSPPTVNTNGTPVVPLAGYHVYYQNGASGTRQSVPVSGGNTTSFEISGLTAGTWYFEVAADAMDGTEGPPSSIGQLTI